MESYYEMTGGMETEMEKSHEQVKIGKLGQRIEMRMMTSQVGIITMENG
jgi:hypothetical protein